jgi:hypothetical protein
LLLFWGIVLFFIQFRYREGGVERGCGRCAEEEGQTMPVVMVIMQQNDAELGGIKGGSINYDLLLARESFCVISVMFSKVSPKCRCWN